MPAAWSSSNEGPQRNSEAGLPSQLDLVVESSEGKTMGPYEFRQRLQDGVVIVEVHGYFNDQAGKALTTLVQDQVRGGHTIFLLDFGPCSVINSTGVATFLDLTLALTEDYQGRLLICGLDRVKQSVLEMVGITSMATLARDVAEALTLAKASSP